MRSSIEQLASLARQVRAAIRERGLTGAGGAEIDHIELFGSPSAPDKADSRSFVLCPGGHYDRSPCGTGTSAKIACLAADGILAPGEIWRQESMIGSVFSATYQPADRDGMVIPTISGRAFVNADLRIVIDPEDPFCVGIPSDLTR
jgi:4-hydroxyproline epimerase